LQGKICVPFHKLSPLGLSYVEKLWYCRATVELATDTCKTSTPDVLTGRTRNR